MSRSREFGLKANARGLADGWWFRRRSDSGRLHVSPVMSAYLMRYPRFRANCGYRSHDQSGGRRPSISPSESATLADSSLVARHVGEMRRIVVASSAYLERRGEPKTPAAIAFA